MATRTADPQRSTVWLRRLPLAIPLLPAALAVVYAVDAFGLGRATGGEPGAWLLWFTAYAVLAAVAFPLVSWWRPREWVTASVVGVLVGLGVWLVVDASARLPEGEPPGASYGPPHPPADWALIMPSVGRAMLLLAVLGVTLTVVLALRAAPLLGLWCASVGALGLARLSASFESREFRAMSTGQPSTDPLGLGGLMTFVGLGAMGFLLAATGFVLALALRRGWVATSAFAAVLGYLCLGIAGVVSPA